jgi:gallate decarboxylase subunit C
MGSTDITTVPGLLEFLKEQGELLVASKEVDPVCEVAGIAKALENGPAILFENIKGYSGQRLLINTFSRRSRMAKIFSVADSKTFKFKCLEAMNKPIQPEIVTKASCQEVVIDKDIDVLKTMPVTQSMETDAGRIISGGVSLVSGADIGHCTAFRRTFFRGKDWASISINPDSHIGYVLPRLREKGLKLPITLNISCPAAVNITAARSSLQWGMPFGTDELAPAGRLQGAPVKICRAKTVDAYSIADAEWVVEGYLDPSQLVWESAEAERTGNELTPFFVEWLGYQGWARNTVKFQATAITHRKNNPVFYSTIASSMEGSNLSAAFAEAISYDIFSRIGSGSAVVKDLNILDFMHGSAGLVIQMTKKSGAHDEFARRLITAAFASSAYLRFVAVVDEDINIYNAEDVMWALMTRVDPRKDIIILNSDTSSSVPIGRRAHGKECKMGFDATAPFDNKSAFKRWKYPAVNLENWFEAKDIAKAKAQQNEYARFLSEDRF